MTHMRKTLAVAGAFAVAVSLAACDRSTDNAVVKTTSPSGETAAPPAEAAEERDSALVRFVHAAPTAPVVDVFADDTPAFQKVQYKAVTPYQEIDGQRYTIRLRPSGQNQGDALASNTEGLDDGDHYTIFALPGADADDPAELRVVQDDFTRPREGKARVRIVHATRNAGEVEVVAAGRDDRLFDGVDAGSVSDYDEIDPWAGQLQVRAGGSEQPLATIASANFEAGKVYTVVVVGRTAAGRGTRTAARGAAAGNVEAFVIEDEIQPIGGAVATSGR
jgi:hypothetical protein